MLSTGEDDNIYICILPIFSPLITVLHTSRYELKVEEKIRPNQKRNGETKQSVLTQVLMAATEGDVRFLKTCVWLAKGCFHHF